MTGTRGPVSTPDGHGHREHPEPLALVPKQDDAPKAPVGLLKATRDAWDAYWRSDVAAASAEVDLPALRRLFKAYDQHERALSLVAKNMFVKGSTGQIVLNPAAKYAQGLESTIAALEGQFGLTPMARQRLGLIAGQNALTAADLNRMASEDLDAADIDDVLEAEGWEAN